MQWRKPDEELDTIVGSDSSCLRSSLMFRVRSLLCFPTISWAEASMPGPCWFVQMRTRLSQSLRQCTLTSCHLELEAIAHSVHSKDSSGIYLSSMRESPGCVGPLFQRMQPICRPNSQHPTPQLGGRILAPLISSTLCFYIFYFRGVDEEKWRGVHEWGGPSLAGRNETAGGCSESLHVPLLPARLTQRRALIGGPIFTMQPQLAAN